MTARRPTRAAWLGALVAGALLLPGCGSSGVPMAPSEPTTPAASPSGRPPFQTMPPLPSGTPAAVPPARWQAITDDLAARGVEGEPVLVSSEAVTWPDSSLGCPSPGVMYTQALVDGLRVVVDAGGRRWDYRLGGGRLKLCER